MRVVCCGCGNVRLDVDSDALPSPPEPWLSSLQLASVIRSELGTNTKTEFPELTSKAVMRNEADEWVVVTCENCHTLCYLQKKIAAFSTSPPLALVNGDLQAYRFDERKGYSDAFNIVIHECDAPMVCPAPAVSRITKIEHSFLERERIEMQQRIERFIAQQQTEFDDMKRRVETEKRNLLNVIGLLHHSGIRAGSITPQSTALVVTAVDGTRTPPTVTFPAISSSSTPSAITGSIASGISNVSSTPTVRTLNVNSGTNNNNSSTSNNKNENSQQQQQNSHSNIRNATLNRLGITANQLNANANNRQEHLGILEDDDDLAGAEFRPRGVSWAGDYNSGRNGDSNNNGNRLAGLRDDSHGFSVPSHLARRRTEPPKRLKHQDSGIFSMDEDTSPRDVHVNTGNDLTSTNGMYFAPRSASAGAVTTTPVTDILEDDDDDDESSLPDAPPIRNVGTSSNNAPPNILILGTSVPISIPKAKPDRVVAPTDALKPDDVAAMPPHTLAEISGFDSEEFPNFRPDRKRFSVK
eukprot:c33160_g1_i1.p1 GENE.c33160_g1_i1~~c33160_g1_i1.p1  ORF type:complete len:525 (+),score=121.64 c33160_g1_i1:112-1686(+)